MSYSVSESDVIETYLKLKKDSLWSKFDLIVLSNPPNTKDKLDSIVGELKILDLITYEIKGGGSNGHSKV